MTIFRPCIDLHRGKVKQIVGSTFDEAGAGLKTNFTSSRSSSWYAGLYKKDGLKGGHIIRLGKGNREAALEALAAYPGGLQIGGGMNPGNAESFLNAGASHIIVTSWIIPGVKLDWDRLEFFSDIVGKNQLVVDLSCRRQGDSWFVAKDKWRTITEEKLNTALLDKLQDYCGEFLVHAVDSEGKQQGIDKKLVEFLGRSVSIPTTYAGGARHLSDLSSVEDLSKGTLDVTIGSALDVFGGTQVAYRDCVEFNRSRKNDQE
ncbi:phosphoribosylformimino-5-aminoimidazole carboxamide ribotide isomerase [Fibrobacterota bacterium]